MRPAHVLSLAAALALVSMTADPAAAKCRLQQTTGTKELRSKQSDTRSFFTLTKGTAVVGVKVTSLPARCSRQGGLVLRMVSAQTGKPINCSGGSVLGPGESLRCKVNVNGGKYWVRARNATSCTVKYQNSCRNS